jgi:hypothetical protein
MVVGLYLYPGEFRRDPAPDSEVQPCRPRRGQIEDLDIHDFHQQLAVVDNQA